MSLSWRLPTTALAILYRSIVLTLLSLVISLATRVRKPPM